MEKYFSLPSPEEAVHLLDRMYVRNLGYDPVIELVWLIGNHVAAICHHAMMSTRDFWPNFITVFQELYLKRVEKQW